MLADLQGVRLVWDLTLPGIPAHTGIVEVECRQLELLTCGQGWQPASGSGDEARARGDEHGDERGDEPCSRPQHRASPTRRLVE